MNLTLQLHGEMEAKLRQEAARTGKTPEGVAIEALEEKLASDAVEGRDANLSVEQWLTTFDDWISSHSSRNPDVDDSRESIYPDRF